MRDRLLTLKGQGVFRAAVRRWRSQVGFRSQDLDIASTLIAQHKFDEADDLIRIRLLRAPDDWVWLEQFAFSAHNRGRYIEAAARWRRVKEVNPDHAMSWSGLAANLRELGELDGAYRVITEALERFSRDVIAVTEAIRIAQRRNAKDEVVDLWRRWVALSEDHLPAYEGLIDALLDLNRIDEAETVVERAKALFPHPLNVLVQAAVVAAGKNRWDLVASVLDEADDEIGRGEHSPGAIALYFDRWAKLAWAKKLLRPLECRSIWERLVEHSPERLDWVQGYVETLISLGCVADAKSHLARGRTLDPRNRGLWLQDAVLAMKEQDWDRAFKIFDAYEACHPDDPAVRDLRGQGLMERGFSTSLIAQPQDVGFVKDDAARELLLKFESMGQDCEFGMVQRRYGAEPLGLFRWNAVRASALIKALSVEFAGLGLPEHTVLSMWDHYEYYLSDLRWGFGFHTFLSKFEQDEDTVYRKMCARLVFLKDKFLLDLRAAEKVFVFKSANMDLSTMQDLHAAMRAYGPVRLLYVQPITCRLLEYPDHKAGHVYELKSGLFVGYLPRLGFTAAGTWDIAFDDWLDLCRAFGTAQTSSMALEAVG